ncbi:hypothetical protein ONS95_010257 [Cadophora gregata]|uniref:uncharacterized protein n=1 Tax=Cadophora gregata TaxID=51156 RepID=UPI0026DCBCF7|nr:uncharacterized protein ONS95_010257 [Cadophora gregata]KAK0121988.1 hypothetical protein ONS95_010257 [Cadophora gregata]KAK0127468.1 hypothetical protein ONS96_007004 [Cadophora gregata f. sp. sojae]
MMEPKISAKPYDWPSDGTLDPTTTALVVIDMQMDFCAPEGYLVHQGYDINPVRAIIPRLQRLLNLFRVHGFPIYHTREGHRPDLSTLSTRELNRSRNNESGLGIGDPGPLGRLLVRGEKGHDINPELYPLQNENVIDKPGRSAFQHTDFGLLLSLKGIKNLVICGDTTDVCVSSTMREANDNGFDCLIVEDATAASEQKLHDAAIASVKAEGGIFGAVTTADKILGALAGFKRTCNY